MILNDFEYTGGSNLGFGAKEVSAEPTNIVDLDAFVQYVAALPQPVVAPREPRFVVVTNQ